MLQFTLTILTILFVPSITVDYNYNVAERAREVDNVMKGEL